VETKYSEEGNETLLVIKEADAFLDWSYEQVKPFIHGSIFEIGSGLGVFSKKLDDDFKDNYKFFTDLDEKYVKDLTNKYSSNNKVSCFQLNAGNKNDFKKLKTKVDTVLLSNVLEHIEDDVGVLKNIHSVLSDSGNLLIIVPAYPWLFNCIDKAVGHYRRYSKKEIIKVVNQAGLQVNDVFYFNALSMLGWFVNGKILRQKTVNKSGMKILNTIVPMLKFLEKHILRRSIGLSLVLSVRKA